MANDTVLSYLGDDVSVRLDNGVVKLRKDRSDGEYKEIIMDRLVLSEFVSWLEDNGVIEVRLVVTRPDKS